MPCSSTLELAAAAPEDEVVVNPLSNTVHAVSEVSTVETRCGWRFDGSGQRARRARTVTDASLYSCGSCFLRRTVFLRRTH